MDDVYDLVVIGAGPVGVEFATVFTALGIPATLVSQSDRPLPAIDGKLAGLVADDRKLLGVHCCGDIASEVVGLGHVVLHVGGSGEVFLTLALNTPTYSYAYHDATVDGLTRLAELMGLAEVFGTASS